MESKVSPELQFLSELAQKKMQDTALLAEQVKAMEKAVADASGTIKKLTEALTKQREAHGKSLQTIVRLCDEKERLEAEVESYRRLFASVISPEQLERLVTQQQGLCQGHSASDPSYFSPEQLERLVVKA
jgi:chromosome segregation ATPase